MQLSILCLTYMQPVADLLAAHNPQSQASYCSTNLELESGMSLKFYVFIFEILFRRATAH